MGKDPQVWGSKILAAINFKQQPRCSGHEFNRRSSNAFAAPRTASTTDPLLGPSGPVLRVNRESLRNQKCLGFVSFPSAGEKVLQEGTTPEHICSSVLMDISSWTPLGSE